MRKDVRLALELAAESAVDLPLCAHCRRDLEHHPRDHSRHGRFHPHGRLPLEGRRLMLDTPKSPGHRAGARASCGFLPEGRIGSVVAGEVLAGTGPQLDLTNRPMAA